MLSDPERSLPATCDILTQFSLISYYKINESKSQILAIHVDRNLGQTLRLNFPFAWATDTIPYLGIKIPHHTSNLYKANFLDLFPKLSLELNKLKVSEISTTGRIAALKMFIVPKLLYLFRTVPIFLPKSFFQKITSMFSWFMWNKKRPRCAASVMTLSRVRGEMGSPNMPNYYKASMLDHVQFWCRPSPQKAWSIMERSQFSGQDPKLTLMALKLSLNPCKNPCPSILLLC